jgi:hypothetical protein
MTDLIPLEYLNEACFLSLNLDEKKYRMCLKMAQEYLSDKILGERLYEQIETQYKAGSLSTDNGNLYEKYIKDFLAWRTYYNYLKFSQDDATPTGFRNFNDENSSLLTDVQMYSKEKNVIAQCKVYEGRITSYIRLQKSKDSTKFPLWYDNCKPQNSFCISAIDGKSNTVISVNKSILTNE